jgi:hypothetical protein
MARSRRAGSRQGVISEALRASLRGEADTLRAISEPSERVRSVNDFYAQLDFELEQFASVRLEAVGELRSAGWSYERISAATGLSKARVAQLARNAQAGGRRA